MNDLEILVVENYSTDDGPSIVRRIAEQDRRVHLLESPKRGPGHARNFGLTFGSGNWILFLDADDLIEPDHLSCLLRASEFYPDKSIIAGGWKEFIDGVSDTLSVKNPTGRNGANKLLDSAIATSPWAMHSAIVRRKLVNQHPFPEEMDGMLAEDNAFWFRLCLAGSVAYSDQSTALYRTQTSNCRTQSHDVDKWFSGVHTAVQKNIAALQDFTGTPPNPKQSAALMQLYSGLYQQAIQAGNKRIADAAKLEATRWLKRAIALDNVRPSLLARRLLGIAWTERLKLRLKTR